MQDKKVLRRELLKMRNSLDGSLVKAYSEKITDILLASGVFDGKKRVFSYLPLGKEVETGEIHEFLFQNNHSVYIPFTDEEDNISPCLLEKNSVLSKSKYQTLVPNKLEILEKEPDLVLVPCVGIDLNGNRIGFGKGCYDRYLKNKSSRTIALCYSFQVVSGIQADENDIPIDHILTENGFVK